MDEVWKEPEANRALLALSKLTRYGKEALNYPGKLPKSVPLLGGMGAGDLVMGEAPEALEDYAYGSGPFHRGAGTTTRMDPRLVDVATLPFLGGVGAKAVKSVLPKQKMLAEAVRGGNVVEHLPEQRALSTVVRGAEPEVDQGRRAVLARGLGLAARTALPAIPGGGMLAKLGEDAATAVVPKVAQAAATGAGTHLAWAKKLQDVLSGGADDLHLMEDFFPEGNYMQPEHHSALAEIAPELGRTMDDLAARGFKADPEYLHNQIASVMSNGDNPELIRKITKLDQAAEGTSDRALAAKMREESGRISDQIMEGQFRAEDWAKKPGNQAILDEYHLTGKIPTGEAAEHVKHIRPSDDVLHRFEDKWGVQHPSIRIWEAIGDEQFPSIH